MPSAAKSPPPVSATDTSTISSSSVRPTRVSDHWYSGASTAASASYRKSSIAPVGAAIDTVGSSSSRTVSSSAGSSVTAASLTVASISTSASPSSTSLSTASTVGVSDAVAALAAKLNVVPSGNAIRSESVESVTVNGMSCTGSTAAVTVAVSPSSRSSSDSVSVTDGPSTIVATELELSASSAIRPSTAPENRMPTLKVSSASSTASAYASNESVAKRPLRPRALPVPEAEKSANATVVVVSFFS